MLAVVPFKIIESPISDVLFLLFLAGFILYQLFSIVKYIWRRRAK